MLFSSIEFLFYFLPAVVLLYFIVPWKLKNSVLLFASLFFYGWGEPKYLLLMVSAIIVFYLLGLWVEKAKSKTTKKITVSCAVIYSVLMMGIFKYADFFITNFNAVTGLNIHLLKLALPIGISFYTFQCLSYVIDVYREKVPAQKNIIDFGTYVSLFPQLIAGPIVRYIDVAKELKERTHTKEKIIYGSQRFVIGLSKKILIANLLGEFVNIFRSSTEKSIVFYWLYAIAFMLHIYFDFSGYSDMAIGLGKIFGFNFIENFNYPYMSKNITEFWRRWHMSLGSWFRDYVYIPLGGNRVSKIRWIFNILVVWALTGLWHGAEWNFVLWGLLYAVLLLIEKFMPTPNETVLKQKVAKATISFSQHFYTLFFVMLGFVLFNANGLSGAWSDVCGLFAFGTLPLINQETIYYLFSYLFVFMIAIIGSTNLPKKIINKCNIKYLAVITSPSMGILLLLCTAYLVDGSFNPFLYFRF